MPHGYHAATKQLAEDGKIPRDKTCKSLKELGLAKKKRINTTWWRKNPRAQISISFPNSYGAKVAQELKFKFPQTTKGPEKSLVEVMESDHHPNGKELANISGQGEIYVESSKIICNLYYLYFIFTV